jgi:hypothetical protein
MLGISDAIFDRGTLAVRAVGCALILVAVTLVLF